MSDYRIEFPDYADAMPSLPEGFVDVSYHNDAAPAFHNRALRLSVFIDYADPQMRDVFSEGSPRFHIFKTDDEGSHLNEDGGDLSTDNWEDVLTYIYETWLAQPNNANVPKTSADDAVHELMVEPPASRSPALTAQINWLMDFWRVWDEVAL